jgi:hypothetical protein
VPRPELGLEAPREVHRGDCPKYNPVYFIASEKLHTPAAICAQNVPPERSAPSHESHRSPGSEQ